MQFERDTRIGPYRIECLIASGGMGDVYRAWHEQLERTVAIKAVAEHIVPDKRVLARFAREARLASQLDHPHICRVYDFMEHEGQPLLILEYLEGETLSARLTRDRLSVAETLRIGAETADALDHAHARGLVHRDLKPSNLMLTTAGVKILDFGLVKRIRASGPESEPGSTDTISDSDAVVGTFPYMAPEQIEGEEADERTDIYALGVILYRCITGRLPFVNRLNAALAAAILHDRPDPITDLVPSAPPALAHVIDRCLEKDRRNRWQAARDLAGELQWLFSSSVRRPPRLRALLGNRYPRGLAVAVAILALTVSGLLLAAALNRGTERPPQVVASSILAPAGVTFQSNHPDAVVSPDGRRVVLSGIDSLGRSGLWLRPLSEQTVRRIEVTQAGRSHTPFWSPDSRMIGYFSRDELRIVNPDAGPSRLVASVSLESRGATWGANVIVYAPEPDGGLFRVSPGSSPAALTTPDRARGEIGHVWPWFLPDGEHFLYLVTSPVDSVRGIYFASLSSPAGRRILAANSSALYASGHILYLREGALVAQPFNAGNGVVSGEPVTVAGSVATIIETLATFSVSTNGVLTFSRGDSKDVTELTWRDTLGRKSGIVGEPGRHMNPALSRNGRLAVETYDISGGDLWVRDLQSNQTMRTNDATLQASDPVWSPDGRSLVFESRLTDGWAIYRWDINSTSPPRVIHTSPTARMPTDWSPDGRYLLLSERTRRNDYDVTRLDLATQQETRWFGERYEEFSARLSPTGRLVAFVSNAPGTFETFIESVPASGIRCRVSVDGGWDPQWGADDHTLFFLDGNGRLMRARVDFEHGCVNGALDHLFDTGIDPRTSRNHYAVAADRDLFLVNSRTTDPRNHIVEVLINWDVILPGRGK